MHPHPARIEAAGDVLDRAVLAGAVTALQYDEHAVRLRAPHLVLQVEQLLAELGEALARRFLRHVFGRIDGDPLDLDFRAALGEDHLSLPPAALALETALH